MESVMHSVVRVTLKYRDAGAGFRVISKSIGIATGDASLRRLCAEFVCTNSRLPRREHESQICPRRGASPGYTAAGCRYGVTKSSPGISLRCIYPAASRTMRETAVSLALALPLSPRPALFLSFSRFLDVPCQTTFSAQKFKQTQRGRISQAH